jgi:hypothetical protein
MERVFEIHFFETKSGCELVETSFQSFDGEVLRCMRGKTAGAFRGAGSFQWTSAVRAIAALSLRHILSQANPSVSKYISGRQASLAASLDYALTKSPCWISDMFGMFQNGQPSARRLFLITNPNQKRPGPVTVAINEATLAARNIKVFLNGLPTEDLSALANILREVDAAFQHECEEHYCEPVRLAS